MATLPTLSNSNYNYEFYPNINLCVFKKSTSTNDKTIGLGSYPTSEDHGWYSLDCLHLYFCF